MGEKKITRRAVYHPFLGDRFKYLRKARGFKQIGIAHAVGYSKGMISRIENGSSGIGLDKFSKVCKVLQVEQNTLSYPTDIPYEYIDKVDRFFKILKSKTPPTELPEIFNLIDQAFLKTQKTS